MIQSLMTILRDRKEDYLIEARKLGSYDIENFQNLSKKEAIFAYGKALGLKEALDILMDFEKAESSEEIRKAYFLENCL